MPRFGEITETMTLQTGNGAVYWHVIQIASVMVKNYRTGPNGYSVTEEKLHYQHRCSNVV